MLTYHLNTHTHTHSTVQPSTDPPNASTPTQLDYERSVTSSYSLQLFSFRGPQLLLFKG